MQNDISRRHFIQAGVAASAVGTLGASAPRRPNILYVFADMQRASSLGAYGDPNVRTPALDAFSTQGARFDAAMSNTPVCCPHRVSLQTGLYGHHHGVVSNSVEFTRQVRGLAEQFREAGYVTGYTGQWHIPGGYGTQDSNPLGFPPEALAAYDFTMPGESGQRNVLRGDGLFNLDLGVSKRFLMPYSESHSLQFRWEMFNFTNSVRFDVQPVPVNLGSAGTFGKYTALLTGPRVMQFSLRYEF